MKRIVYIDNFLAHYGYAPTTGYALVRLLKKEGFEVVPVSDKKNQMFRLLHMLLTVVKYRKNTVVLIATYSTSAFYFAYSCGWLCHLLHIPYVTCLHGGNLPERIAVSPRLVSRYFGKSDMNVAVSGYLQQALLNNGWQCIIIPNAINLSQYPFKQRNAANPKLLWVRSFHQVYRPQMAIQVLYKLSKIYADATLTMVGPDKDGSLAACKELAASLQVQHRVVFTGRLTQKEWTQLSLAHDIFINTTTTDNLPVSVIEAMALGMIVISTNVGGIPYLIEDGTNGMLVNSSDADAMVSCIEKIVTDQNLAASLSQRACESAQQYDEQTVITKWKRLLNNIR